MNNRLYYSVFTNLFLITILFNKVNCDIPREYQYDFQDPASSFQEGIIYLHDDLIFLLSFIFGFVFMILFLIVKHFGDSRTSFNSESLKTKKDLVLSTFFYQAPVFHTFLEFIWTIIPSFILLVLILPTFSLIYALDDLFDIQLTLKIIGHQWYWSYEYSDLSNYNNFSNNENDTAIIITYTFDSYMVQESDLLKGSLRLLEVDNRVVLPTHVHIRLLVTSADVLHSWAVPSLGVKMDACPGRLNQVALFITRPGVFYGQCSEICGINHAFMPICVESVL